MSTLSNRVAARWFQAARSDFLLQIDRAFDAAGVYPPNMRQVAPGTYEGEVDAGVVLRAQEAPPIFWLDENEKPGWDGLKALIEQFKAPSTKSSLLNAKDRFKQLFDAINLKLYSLWPDGDNELWGLTKVKNIRSISFVKDGILPNPLPWIAKDHGSFLIVDAVWSFNQISGRGMPLPEMTNIDATVALPGKTNGLPNIIRSRDAWDEYATTKFDDAPVYEAVQTFLDEFEAGKIDPASVSIM